MAGGAADWAAWELPPWKPSRTTTPVAAKNRDIVTIFLLITQYPRWIEVWRSGRLATMLVSAMYLIRTLRLAPSPFRHERFLVDRILRRCRIDGGHSRTTFQLSYASASTISTNEPI